MKMCPAPVQQRKQTVSLPDGGPPSLMKRRRRRRGASLFNVSVLSPGLSELLRSVGASRVFNGFVV